MTGSGHDQHYVTDLPRTTTSPPSTSPITSTTPAGSFAQRSIASHRRLSLVSQSRQRHLLSFHPAAAEADDSPPPSQHSVWAQDAIFHRSPRSLAITYTLFAPSDTRPYPPIQSWIEWQQDCFHKFSASQFIHPSTSSSPKKTLFRRRLSRRAYQQPLVMSEDQVGGDAFSVDAPIELDGGALQFLAKEILEDCLQNIIADVAKEVHREEKLLRMNSAATIADQAALAQTTENSTPVTKGAPPPPPNIRVETPGAVFENGKIYLRGNPFKTTPEIICAKCKLPKLLYPIMGKGSQPPDLSREYCMHYPLVSKSGVDVYGNPFPTDQAKMTKKEREQLRRAEKDNTPGSQDTTTNPEGINKLNTGGKPASYIPWHTCPTCKRSLLITRFSQHLEKCLGISGRQSSRNAMAKLNGQNGNTPLESRTGTPQPGASQSSGAAMNSKKSPIKRTEGDGEGNDEEAGDTPKKKKKSSYVKKADREKLAAVAAAGAASSGSGKNSKSSSKRPPKDKSESIMDGIKREREDNNDGDAPRKKIKLIKEDSSYTMGGEDGGPSPGSTAD